MNNKCTLYLLPIILLIFSSSIHAYHCPKPDEISQKEDGLFYSKLEGWQDYRLPLKNDVYSKSYGQLYSLEDEIICLLSVTIDKRKASCQYITKYTKVFLEKKGKFKAVNTDKVVWKNTGPERYSVLIVKDSNIDPEFVDAD